MADEDAESQLRRATEDVLAAEKLLGELAERVRTYPEAAQRLQEVCGALDLATKGMQSAALSMSGHLAAMQAAVRRVDAGIEKMEQIRSSFVAVIEGANTKLAADVGDTSRRVDESSASVLEAIKVVLTALEKQTPMIERASRKRGIVF